MDSVLGEGPPMDSVLMDSVLGDGPAPVPAAPVSGNTAPAVPSGPKLRAFGDSATTRQRIFDNVLAATAGIQPITNQRHTLRLDDVKYTGPERFSRKEYKQALLQGNSLTRKLQGRWSLLDNATGQTLSERRTTLADVPYMTDHGTFVQNGNEVSLSHQMRLHPGAFAREKNNGELETFVNILPGEGQSFRLQLHPETGIYKMQLGQASLPLYPLLRAMGVGKEQIQEAWGGELAAANAGKGDGQTIGKLYDRIVRTQTPTTDPNERAAALTEAFSKMKLDPYISKRTLGGDFDKVDGNMLLAATKKLLAINRREAEPDDRDHLAYQKLYGPEDLLAERIQKDQTGLRNLLWRASSKQSLGHMQPGTFNKAIQAVMLSSGLAQSLEEINPLEILDQQSRVSRLGTGGIPSVDAIPDEARAVQPSHFGFVDILRTPESEKIGVDMRLSRASMKGDDGQIYTSVRDLRTGQESLKTPRDLADSVIAMPGELNKESRYVKALVGGKMRYVDRSKVDYSPSNMEDTFSPLTNLVPLKSMVKGQRAIMAARMITQALPLQGGEAPLVQSALPGKTDESYEDRYGKHAGAIRADKPGRVASVDADSINVEYEDGTKDSIELHNQSPLNRKTLYHQDALVKPGDTIQPGQLLARSNFTDEKGTAAIGRNLRVAYIPFKGKNFEDAIIVSQSAARKLTSEHAYQHTAEWEDSHRRGKRSFMGLFPSTYDKKTLANFDDDGVIKPGTKVNYGDPLLLLAREREHTQAQVHRGRAPNFLDDSVTWDHHVEGVVTDVGLTKKGVNIVVKSLHPMEEGDKLSGRYGDKGVVHVIPDDEMPTDSEGQPFEVLSNPLGVISRTNPAQIVEAALGKIAAKTGKPYKLEDWSGQDMREFAERELRKNNMSDTEDIIDPETGRKIPGVLTGNRFFMKLHHTAESKTQGRSFGGYSAEGSPTKSNGGATKRLGNLEMNALLSHGALSVARDAKMVRGQAHPEYWSQFMAGYTPPPTEVPMVYKKFVNQLRAAGINPVREGTKTHIMAMTDKDVDDLAGDRELQNAETVDWRDALKPKPGGLFDPKITGGHGHEGQWAKITLNQPMPNPVMEDAIRRVLGITEKDMREIIAGRQEFQGRKGPTALQDALSAINLPKALEQAREDIRSGKKTARDKAVRKFGYLKSAERLGIHPKDWMVSKTPVLPPAFRPISLIGPKKLPLVSDANYLYKELFDANKNLKDLGEQVDDVGDERLALYDSLKAVVGLGDPLQPKNQERNVRGVLKQVFAGSPKMSVIQRKLLSTNMDLVGRAVISPNPDLDMDSVGLPEDKAWDVYAPFVVRNLARRGMQGHRAMEMVKDRTQVAKDALLDEMGKRPVIYTRAPVLHRYGVMAAWPKLTKSKTLQLSPLVIGGFAGDFDGDAMNFYVPASMDAADEAAEKMLPSKNLLSASNFKAHYKPTQEYLGGLYAASAQIDKDKPVRTFRTKTDAIRAYKQGEIGVGRRIEILEP